MGGLNWTPVQWAWLGPGVGLAGAVGSHGEHFRFTREILKQSPGARSNVRIGGVFVRQIINWFLLCQALC